MASLLPNLEQPNGSFSSTIDASSLNQWGDHGTMSQESNNQDHQSLNCFGQPLFDVDPHMNLSTSQSNTMASPSTLVPEACKHSSPSKSDIDVSESKTSEDQRPSISYARLAAMAIEAAPNQCCTVSEMYAWIEARYPYYKKNNPWWKNCIRHNLSMKKCFIRVSIESKFKWTIDPAYQHELRAENSSKPLSSRKRRQSAPPAMASNSQKPSKPTKSRKRRSRRASETSAPTTAPMSASLPMTITQPNFHDDVFLPSNPITQEDLVFSQWNVMNDSGGLSPITKPVSNPATNPSSTFADGQMWYSPEMFGVSPISRLEMSQLSSSLPPSLDISSSSSSNPSSQFPYLDFQNTQWDASSSSFL